MSRHRHADRTTHGLRLRSPGAVAATARHALGRPAPGRAVLACRCGAMLDLADMHRAPRSGPWRGGSALVEPIRCHSCAEVRR